MKVLLFWKCFSLSAFPYAEEDGSKELNESISGLLEDLDLSELQQYLDEHSDSFLFNFGDTAKEIVNYLIKGNLDTDYGSYIKELFNVIFKNVISLIPAFAEVTAIALLCAVVTTAEGKLIGKSTSKIVRLSCYSLIIMIFRKAQACPISFQIPNLLPNLR